jgi:hypothetical protein
VVDFGDDLGVFEEGEVDNGVERVMASSCGQRRRSLLATTRGGGWRRAARRCAPGLGVGVELLQIKQNGEVRQRRRVEVVGIEEREGALAHWRCRIWPEKSAGVRHFDEKSLGLGGISDGEGKRGRGRCSRGLYSGRYHGGGVRVLALGEIDGGDVCRALPGL